MGGLIVWNEENIMQLSLTESNYFPDKESSDKIRSLVNFLYLKCFYICMQYTGGARSKLTDTNGHIQDRLKESNKIQQYADIYLVLN